MSLKITVTAEHIQNAKPLPNSSPIALALRELGHEDATVGRSYACFGRRVYSLPEIAIANEIHFDFVAKQGKIQGEAMSALEGYEFELEAIAL